MELGKWGAGLLGRSHQPGKLKAAVTGESVVKSAELANWSICTCGYWTTTRGLESV